MGFWDWLFGRKSVVIQKGNVAGGHIAGGSITFDDVTVGRSLRVGGGRINAGRARCGAVVANSIHCQGSLCITNNKVAIDGVSFSIGKVSGQRVFYIDDVPYLPWDTSMAPCPLPDKKYPPWTGEMNGCQIKVSARSITVDGVEFRRSELDTVS